MRQTVEEGIRSYYTIERLAYEQAVAHAEEIVSIYRECWLTTYPNEELGITRHDIEERFSNFSEVVEKWKKSILNQDDRAVWVAKEKTEDIIGFCIAKRQKGFNELEYMYILAAHQRKGIGSKLMQKALDWMGTAKPIVLFGAAYNDSAIAFYEKFGFKLSNEAIPPKQLPSGKALPSMKMTKKKSCSFYNST